MISPIQWPPATSFSASAKSCAARAKLGRPWPGEACATALKIDPLLGVETWENHRKVIGKHGKRGEIWEINYKWKLNMIFSWDLT